MQCDAERMRRYRSLGDYNTVFFFKSEATEGRYVAIYTDPDPDFYYNTDPDPGPDPGKQTTFVQRSKTNVGHIFLQQKK